MKSDELEEDDLVEIKQKVDTSKKKKAVAAFPEDQQEIKDILLEEVPYRIIGVFKEVSGTIRGDTKKWKPPKGRYGITNQLQYWDVELEDLDITDVKRSQFLQIHGNFNARGSTLEYGDSVDFDATMKVWTPALDYDETKPVIEKIIKLSRLKKFGPFRHAKMVFVN